MDTVHRNIKRLREELGLSLRELGEKCDADGTHAWHWEQGDNAPNLRRLPKVAAALRVSIDALLTDPKCKPRPIDAPQKASRSRSRRST